MLFSACTVNWCQHWFEYFPNPPLNILSMVENVLAHHDKELLQHLVRCGITSQVKEMAHLVSHAFVFYSPNLAAYLRALIHSPCIFVAAVCVAPPGDSVLRGFDP